MWSDPWSGSWSGPRSGRDPVRGPVRDPVQVLSTPTISKITKEIFVRFVDNLKTPTQTYKVHELRYANSCLYASDFPFKNFCKLAQHAETIRKNVWEKGNDAYSLLIRVQTTINHISISFVSTISTSKKMFLFSERELKRDTLTRAAWYGLSPLDNGLVIFDWFVLSLRMQVILNPLFARPGSAPFRAGRKESSGTGLEGPLHILTKNNAGVEFDSV